MVMNQAAPLLSRWKFALAIVSVDWTEPYLSEVGLSEVDAESLRSVSRRVLTHIARPIEVGRSPSDLIEYVEREVDRHLDKNTAALFRGFVENGFGLEGDEDAQEFLWTILLTGIEKPDTTGRLIDLPLSPDKNFWLRAEASHLGQAWSPVQLPSTDEWDSRLQALLPGLDVKDWLADAVRYQRFRKVWKRITPMLLDTERAAMLSWGRERARSKGMPPELIAWPPS